MNPLAFEKNFERNVFQLRDQLLQGNYSPGHSIAFIVNHPIIRDIFATDFRDGNPSLVGKYA